MFEACCGPILSGRPASTAERLMRSRYTAFAIGDDVHLMQSWHPSTRPERVEIDPELRWVHLDILATRAGGPFDSDGVVEFEAIHRDTGGRGVLKESSRFVREEGHWYYVDGVVS